jgi:WD40 repeat protein
VATTGAVSRDGSVARYDAHGDPSGFFAAQSGNPVLSVAAGATVLAALTVSRGVFPHHAHDPFQIQHNNADNPVDNVSVSSGIELEVWSAGVGGDSVFRVELPGEITHDAGNGHLLGRPGGRAGVEVHSRDPTVFAATPKSLRCFSAVHTGSWECVWDVVAPSGLHEVRLVLDRTLAVLARGGVTLRDSSTGDVSAVLLDATELGVRCSALSVGNGNVMFGALDPTLGEAALHVCDVMTGRHRASLDVPGARGVSSARCTPEDPSLVAVTSHGDSVVRIYDMRSDGRLPVQSLRDASRPRGRAEWRAVDWENWRLAAGGVLGGGRTSGTVAVFDRRTSERLWYVDVTAPVLDLAVQRDGASLWASSATRSGSVGQSASVATFPPFASCLTVRDYLPACLHALVASRNGTLLFAFLFAFEF